MIVLAELVQIVQIRERVQSVQTGTVQPSSNLARKRHVRRWRDSAEFDCFGEHFSVRIRGQSFLPPLMSPIAIAFGLFIWLGEFVLGRVLG